MIEYNIEAITAAGWVLDLGSQGGNTGGQTPDAAEQDARAGRSLSARRPEQVVKGARSSTGHSLAPLLTNAAHSEGLSGEVQSASRKKLNKPWPAFVRKQETAE